MCCGEAGASLLAQGSCRPCPGAAVQPSCTWCPTHPTGALGSGSRSCCSGQMRGKVTTGGDSHTPRLMVGARHTPPHITHHLRCIPHTTSQCGARQAHHRQHVTLPSLSTFTSHTPMSDTPLTRRHVLSHTPHILSFTQLTTYHTYTRIGTSPRTLVRPGS